MLKPSAFYVVWFTLAVFVSAKSLDHADNETEARSLESEQHVESSVVNDNICNNHEKTVAFDVILFDNNSPSQHGERKIVNKRQAPGDNRNDYKDRPRPDQKSLLIVFDATGSMHDDLEQLRAGAQEIVTELSARQDNPIYNYVLVVYRDPTVEPPFDTKNPDDLLAKLKYIQTVGGGDCAEYALSGLKIALEFALPSSLAYVFSDATAKDLRFYSDVLGLIQKKQVTVNFLLTGNCDDPTGPGYQVYQKLSRASNGQVYDMNKSNVKDVLLAIRHTVNYNYAALKSVDTESAGTSNTKLTIDKSISELSVSLSGKNPQLTIRDPRNETIRSGDELSLTNLRLIKIKDPVDGLWNVEAGADSSHSIRLGAISELKFEFGFSIDEPKKRSETSFQPLTAAKNVLSIFVSDPNLIRDLSDVTIILIPLSVHESSLQFKIPLKKIEDHIYATKAFDVPRQMFKVQLNGVDANGNPIERLISTGLHSSQGSVPEIEIEVNQREINEFEKLLLKCVVKSHMPVNISWVFEGNTLSQVFSNQSNDLELVINHVKNSNSGQYTCDAINSFGGERREISVKVLSAPKVQINPKTLTLVEGSKGVLTCAVGSNEDVNVQIEWLDAERKVLQNDVSPLYEFVARRELHNQKITCQVQSREFLVSNSSLIQVQYPPSFIDGRESKSLKILHGDNIELQCRTDANPAAATSWFFTATDSSEKQNLQNRKEVLIIESMNESKQGSYECFVENSYGKVNRNFEVIEAPRGPPKIVMEKDVIIVNETESIDLVCESLNSLPMRNSSWLNENSNHYERFEVKDDKRDVFKSILRIVAIDESDNGSFECFLANDAGEDKISIELLVQTAPKIDTIMLKANDVETEVESNAKVLENDFITLDCVVDGFPTPDINWYKDQEELPIESNETSLTFQHILEHDAGHYQCLATNLLGIATKSFNLGVNVPPKTQSKRENMLQALEGENLTMNCDIYGNPSPRITWLLNEKPVAEGGLSKDYKTFSFKARLTSSGVYSCLGVNDFGSLSINFTVVVMGMPKILLPNDEQHEARRNSDLVLSCDASGYPQPHISWSKDDKFIQDGSRLSLQKLRFEDSGAFVCSAANKVGSSEKVFYVTVFDTPAITSNFENITLFTNQTKVVKCEASGRPDPEVHWTFDGVKISSGRSIVFSSNMSSGSYACVAESSKGKIESTFFFSAVNKPSMVTNYDELKKEIKLREGDGLELLCPFENFNKILWTFSNKTVEGLPHTINGNQIRIHKIDRSVSGEWRCFVSNLAGDNSFSFNVTVLASPIIHASWNLNDRVSDFLVTESDIDEKIFKVGETLTLNCTAQGFPKPKVLWKQGTDVIAESETLVIEHLQFHHSDIYTCSAENDQGVVKKFFKIDVVSQPFIGDGDVQKSFHQAIGDSVTLRCRIIGNPIPNIFWFKDNVLLDDETETHLEIKRLSIDDDGTYKCIGKNSWGREAIEFNVSVMRGAKIVKAEEEQKVTRNENSMKLSCIVQGNPLPVISWILNGHILSTTSKLNLAKLFTTIKDSTVHFNGYGNAITYLDPLLLKKSKDKFYSQLTKLSESSLKLDIVFKDRSLKQAGIYQCYSYNALGRDEKAVEVKVYEKPFVNEKQMDQLYDNELLEGLPLLLTCLISGEPAPKIEWFKENSRLYENDTIKLLSSNRFLSIAETFSWNSGNYSCKGSNEIGEETLNFSVFVLAPPKFIDYSIITSTVNAKRFHNDKVKVDQTSESNNLVKVSKGEDVSLECFAEGSPNPNIHWLKMDFYDASRNELLDENGNVLAIRAIKESSNFMCYINNTVGNIHKIFNVIVEFAPIFVEKEKPENHHVVKLHHGVNLNCKVEGNPEPKIKWISNGTEVSTDDKDFYFSDENQVLRINNAKKIDQGKFLCVVENSFGRIERVFYVKVEVPIQWSAFGQWSTCSVSCGAGGIQYRTRICLLTNGFPATADDYRCAGENVEARKCNRLQCPVNGSWGKFSKWTKCPECVEMRNEETPVLSKRFRKCDSPAPSNGGLDCSGSDVEEVECNVGLCPVNGGWSSWSSLSVCSKTCGVSHRMRKRMCNNPVPKNNGTYCTGENVEYEECKLPPCINQHLKKSFSSIDEDELEELSNESRDKYGEVAEFEIKDEAGISRNFQFSNHREVEFSPPSKEVNGFKIPKIKVTLDTFKPISEETYNQHMSKVKQKKSEAAEELFESTSFENIEFESTEMPRKTCMRGFYFNSIESQCRDINECQNSRQNNCTSTETCINMLGSFRCEERARRSRE